MPLVYKYADNTRTTVFIFSMAILLMFSPAVDYVTRML